MQVARFFVAVTAGTTCSCRFFSVVLPGDAINVRKLNVAVNELVLLAV
jgi:hypothetical protein